MNDTFYVIPYDNVSDMVETAMCGMDREDNRAYSSIGFVGDANLTCKILGVLLSDYVVSIASLHIDDVDNNDTYCLTIDEGYYVSVDSVCNGCGDYLVPDVDMQYINEYVSTGYVNKVNESGGGYEVFSLEADNENDAELNEKDIDCNGRFTEAAPCSWNTLLAVALGKQTYDSLSKQEKRLFDLMVDWVLD